MATHDYVLDNASGADFRADANNALAAIVSNNSNSSSPSTTYAYQWWADTSNNVLKIRNSANNDWIELFQLDGTLTLEDGSASTPALAFRDDLNTGIFSGSADEFNIATAGVERLVINSSGQVGIGADPVSNNKLHLRLADSSVATPSSASVLLAENSGNSFITIASGASSLAGVLFADSGQSDRGQVRYNHNGDIMQFIANEEKFIQATLNGSVEIYFDNSKKCESTSAGITVTGTVTETSDKAFKSNIQPLTNTLEKIKQITGYKYNLNSQPSMGVIAQDVEKVFPELVHGFEGQKSLQYSGLIGVLVEAVKDLSTKVAALEAA
tara:strand:+ start:379 stop:1356 length:978 start_codon:yes stop_codon:yes gene_type:complete